MAIPPQNSGDQIGVIHAAPIVVNGCVFGTATNSLFNRPPMGRPLVYRNPATAEGEASASERKVMPDFATAGRAGSPLVTEDTVYYSDSAAGSMPSIGRPKRALEAEYAAESPPCAPISLFRFPFIARS